MKTQYAISMISAFLMHGTLEENLNNRLYIITTQMNANTPTWHQAVALEIPSGNYTGTSLALALQAELHFAEPDHQVVCT